MSSGTWPTPGVFISPSRFGLTPSPDKTCSSTAARTPAIRRLVICVCSWSTSASVCLLTLVQAAIVSGLAS